MCFRCFSPRANLMVDITPILPDGSGIPSQFQGTELKDKSHDVATPSAGEEAILVLFLVRENAPLYRRCDINHGGRRGKRRGESSHDLATSLLYRFGCCCCRMRAFVLRSTMADCLWSSAWW
ncbi:hypothetical protein DL95DRAFT_182244 [Leptodontidium sp. 2 PMI_412]|nr:hypothetical protein DL95DRAFT_182244 [Leptodontidium sp. 2 PMI_412]